MAMNIKPDPTVLSMLSKLNARDVADARPQDVKRGFDTSQQQNQSATNRIGGNGPAIDDNRVAGGLSSAADLQAAKERAIDFSSTNREAPFGRLSNTISAGGERSFRLGQIIDIRV